MVHVCQEVYGLRRSARSYHNREWARKIKEIGLQPSHTGFPGGRETGAADVPFYCARGSLCPGLRPISGYWIPAALGKLAATREERRESAKVFLPSLSIECLG